MVIARKRKEKESDRFPTYLPNASVRVVGNVIADLYFILITRCFVYFRRSLNYIVLRTWGREVNEAKSSKKYRKFLAANLRVHRSFLIKSEIQFYLISELEYCHSRTESKFSK